MKLVRRLSLAIGLGICLVLALHAWTRIELDLRDYRSDVRRDHDVTGRSLATAVELLWRTEGEARARDVIEELNLRESHVRIRWVWPTAREEAPLRVDLVPRASAATRSEVVDGEGGVPFMLSYTPVDLPGPNDGAIELYESLANERSHARATLVRAAVTTAVLVLLCVGLTFGFGLLFVARPLRRLALKARRIGEGDLGTPLHVAQRDEIRDVAIAMNEMCDRLAETRAGLEEETTAKLAALEQVRHLDRLRIIGQLASRIAHELGTPLNVVRVRGAMIAEAELPVARLRELGATIVEQSDRMTGIIRELLLFARRDPARPYPTDLVRIVKQAVEWLHPLAVEHGVALELESAVDDLPLTVDPSRIQQAVTNLILNAIHASPPGETVRVRVRSGDEACIEIVDHGAGIPVEDAGRLFEPFFTTKPAGEGTGLGLSIANEIVHEHGGRICLESGRGPGTVFSIRLPHPGGMKTAHP